METMNTKGEFLNSSSCKIKYALTFLRSLSKIKRSETRPRSGSSSSLSSSVDEIKKRSQRIKVASYSSMARAVGPGKAWSRATLLNLRRRARHKSLIIRNNRGRLFKKKKKKKKKILQNKKKGKINEADKLRGLVPGGKTMDMCRLLEETAHYIDCLNTQVQVMQTIAHYYCSNV